MIAVDFALQTALKLLINSVSFTFYLVTKDGVKDESNHANREVSTD